VVTSLNLVFSFYDFSARSVLNFLHLMFFSVWWKTSTPTVKYEMEILLCITFRVHTH